jgi:hypothetical protein
MHQIYDKTFGKQINKDIKLIIGNRDAEKDLIRKRPKQSFLKNKPQKKEVSPSVKQNATKTIRTKIKS